MRCITWTAPATSVFYNAEVSARRYPQKPYLIFYDTPVTFSAFLDEAERVAGFLEQRHGVRKGDRVLLLHAEQPAIRHRLLWDPARGRGRRTHQSHVPDAGTVAIRGGCGGHDGLSCRRSFTRESSRCWPAAC